MEVLVELFDLLASPIFSRFDPPDCSGLTMQISFANQCALLILVLISMYLEVTGELGLLLKPIITVRGGARPISPHPDHFFNQFDLDYGSVDDRRVAGFLNGFITSGKLLSPRQEDPFSQWLFEHVERGKSHADLRTRFVRPKAYYVSQSCSYLISF